MAFLDVRSILELGDDPTSTIIEAMSRLETSETLELVMPFQPVPLYRHMEQLGYVHEAQRIENNGWRITFKRI